ncbi:MAG: PCYCGC motif-containing (lipo)protein [bacterium]
MDTSPTSRRSFLAACSVTLAALLLRPAQAQAAGAARPAAGPHPAPRAGITGAKVLTAAQLSKTPDLIPLFDAVREVPEIIDGIRCNCGCGESQKLYSLLSCYEGDAMARACTICQGQGRLATRLHKLGRSLDEIRIAIDAKYA